MADSDIDQSEQAVEGDQANSGKDAGSAPAGDVVNGDKVGGDKIDTQINTGGGTYIGGSVTAETVVTGDQYIIYQGVPPEAEKPFNPKIEPQTVPIPGGTFLMSSPDDETETHPVDLPDFRIGRFPITQGQYQQFIRKNKSFDPPADWKSRKPQKPKNHPVTGVSWGDAMAYCDWLFEETGRRYRLPSELEWEKAASWAPGQNDEPLKKRRYPWGDDWIDGACNVGGEGTTAVDESGYEQGASAYGVRDLLGNVEEWTRTVWHKRPYDPDDDAREVYELEDLEPRDRMVTRGGHYGTPAEDVSNTWRSRARHDTRIEFRGFRVVRE